jgi:hypothetical protein
MVIAPTTPGFVSALGTPNRDGLIWMDNEAFVGIESANMTVLPHDVRIDKVDISSAAFGFSHECQLRLTRTNCSILRRLI